MGRRKRNQFKKNNKFSTKEYKKRKLTNVETEIKADIYHYSCMIKALIKSNKLNEAKKKLEEMENNNIKPDDIILNILLNKYLENGNYKEVIKLFNNIENKYKIKLTINHYNCTIKALINSNKFNEKYYKNHLKIMKLLIFFWKKINDFKHYPLHKGEKIYNKKLKQIQEYFKMMKGRNYF